MNLRVTRNSFLGNYYAKRMEVSPFFSPSLPPSALDNSPRKQKWTLFLRLHYPCRWHITSFSLLAQVQSSRSLIKPKLPDCFFPFFFFPRVEGASTNLDPRGKFERSRAKLVLSRNNRARFIHRCGNAPLGNFPRKVFPGQKENFRASIL